MDKNKKLFPQRLWELIHDGRYNFCLRWSPDGQRVYLNRAEFEAHYLRTPNNQFHTQKAISFVRQMNMYGFKKVDDCYYENENFRRNCHHLLKNMVRRNSNKSALTGATTTTTTTTTNSSSSNANSRSHSNGSHSGSQYEQDDIMLINGNGHGHHHANGIGHNSGHHATSLGDSDNEFGPSNGHEFGGGNLRHSSEAPMVGADFAGNPLAVLQQQQNYHQLHQQQHELANGHSAMQLQQQHQHQQLNNNLHHQHQHNQQHIVPQPLTPQQQRQVAELLQQVGQQTAPLGASPSVSPNQQHDNNMTPQQAASNNAALLSAVSALMAAIGTSAVARTPLASSLYHRLAAVNFAGNAMTNGHQSLNQQQQHHHHHQQQQQHHQAHTNGTNLQQQHLLSNQLNLLDLNQNLAAAQLLNGVTVANGNGHQLGSPNNALAARQHNGQINDLNGVLSGINGNSNSNNLTNGTSNGTSSISSSSSSSAASITASLISSQAPCQTSGGSSNFNIADIPMGPQEAMLTRQAFQQSLVQSLLLLNQQQPVQNVDQNFLLNLQRQQQALQQLQQQQALQQQQHQQHQQQQQQLQQHALQNQQQLLNHHQQQQNNQQENQLLETEDSQVLPLKLTINRR